MEKYLSVLKSCILFKDLENDIEKVIKCLEPIEKDYSKDNVIIFTGEPVLHIGVVLQGSVKIVREDINGNINILTEIEEGGIFGESFACSEMSKSLVSVIASSDCKVMYIDFKKIITLCQSVCHYHTKLIVNTIKSFASKNIVLTKKMEIISKNTIREKLMCYFEMQSREVGSLRFTIPYNRTELAEYLCTDRSSMSRELNKMKKDCVIEFEKNTFTLIKL